MASPETSPLLAPAPAAAARSAGAPRGRQQQAASGSRDTAEEEEELGSADDSVTSEDEEEKEEALGGDEGGENDQVGRELVLCVCDWLHIHLDTHLTLTIARGARAGCCCPECVQHPAPAQQQAFQARLAPPTGRCEARGVMPPVICSMRVIPS